ncbi:SpoIIIAH-like family protein [Anaeromicropila populeti]|uniref:Stage III sporulation protein AH n=1 Tax=Anaeromicropila populeti TaxID=37658 RepID=A0A1I6ILC5_9FIRM|nr:SpoIIIAH-like family protein [Anaeromicropila populeti]SFR67542.1 stage III sporulation protein AH [Anaeromicropila populeti]
MRKILKKNQVIITALVLMVAVAGYLTFTQQNIGKDGNPNGGSGESLSKEASELLENDLYNDLSEEEAVDTDSEAVAETGEEVTDVVDTEGENEILDLSAEDIGEDALAEEDTEGVKVADEDAENPGEAVLVSNTISADYFNNAKIQREQVRSQNKETLNEIINNKNISDEQKQDAIDSMVNMTTIAEKESAAELLLQAKGFADVVISIGEDGADVLVNATNLTEQQMAQIEDIVKRKTGLPANNIVITPVGVTEETR